jgi:hypothetical protein
VRTFDDICPKGVKPMSRFAIPSLFAIVVLTRSAGAATAVVPPPVTEPPKPTVIVNTTAQPVPVAGTVKVDTTAPVTVAGTVKIDSGTPVTVSLIDTADYVVPAGMRLIIEYLSVISSTSKSPDQIQLGLSRLQLANGNNVTTFVIPTQTYVLGNPFIELETGGSTLVRISVPAGSRVSFFVDLALVAGLTTLDVTTQGTFSGTLVPAP